MKRPLARGSPINMRRMRRWTADFPGYRINVNEDRIGRWLNQFQQADRDIAARVLDSVEFITQEQMSAAYRSLPASLPGWHIDEAQRVGTWRFVPFSASAGESGDTMLHKFRLANRMSGRGFNHLYIYKSDLLKEDLGPADSVVFIDDFSGSGQQVHDNWPALKELLPGNPNAYLGLIATTTRARQRVLAETEIIPVPHIILGDEDNIFAPSCIHFNQAEKDTLLRYCRRANHNEPRGFNDSGLLTVLAHNCPNNSIPILHRSSARWEGLFRRYD